MRGPFAALLGIGALWGMSTPLAKFAVTGGHQAFGMIQWQTAINILVLGLACAAGRVRVPLRARHLRLYAVVGLLGMALPHAASYSAAVWLPAGVLSVILSLVPIFALPVALVLRQERFRPLRGIGLLLGAGAVLLLVGPEATVPPALWPFVALAALGPLLYAVEGAYVAGFGARDVGPLPVMLGGSVVAHLAVTPMALLTGQAVSPLRVWGPADLAVAGGAGVSMLAYIGYVWLLRRAGAVFAAQVSYLVTGFGVVWAMLLLGESFGPWFWLALTLLFAGLFLVQPRPGPLPDQGVAAN